MMNDREKQVIDDEQGASVNPGSKVTMWLVLSVLLIIGAVMLWPKTGDNTGYPDNQVTQGSMPGTTQGDITGTTQGSTQDTTGTVNSGPGLAARDNGINK